MLTLSLSVVATDASIVFEVDPFIAAYANALGVEPVTYCAQYHRPDGSMMEQGLLQPEAVIDSLLSKKKKTVVLTANLPVRTHLLLTVVNEVATPRSVTRTFPGSLQRIAGLTVFSSRTPRYAASVDVAALTCTGQVSEAPDQITQAQPLGPEQLEVVIRCTSSTVESVL